MSTKIMKTSRYFIDEKRNNVEIWHESVGGKVSFWKKINGISFRVTERQYMNIIKKYNLLDF